MMGFLDFVWGVVVALEHQQKRRHFLERKDVVLFFQSFLLEIIEMILDFMIFSMLKWCVVPFGLLLADVLP